MTRPRLSKSQVNRAENQLHSLLSTMTKDYTTKLKI